MELKIEQKNSWRTGGESGKTEKRNRGKNIIIKGVADEKNDNIEEKIGEIIEEIGVNNGRKP